MAESNRLPLPMRRYLEQLDLTEVEIVLEINSLFTSEHPLVTHFGVAQGNDILLFGKKLFDEEDITKKCDFMTGHTFGTYRVRPCDRIENYDDLNGINKDLRATIMLENKAPGLWGLVAQDLPNLDRCFFLAHVRGERCWILGFYGETHSIHKKMTREDIEQANWSADLITEALHDFQVEKSKFSVKVHSSIFDRVKNDGISISSTYITEKNGILENPMPISFSPKVEKELGLYQGSQCVLFRDKENLLLTIREDGEERLVCLPFEELVDSGGKIRSSRIGTVVRRNMALARNQKGVSIQSLKTIWSRRRDKDVPLSTVGRSFRLSSMGAEMGTNSQVRAYDEEAVVYSKIVPLLIYLCIAKYSPDLWNKSEIKPSQESGAGRNPNSKQKRNRILNWGTDKVRYVSFGKGHSVSRHWVNSFIRRIPLKRKETIASYRNKGWRIVNEDGQVFGFCLISSHFRGIGGTSSWDGTYNFGKKPRHYSKKAIRWLTWTEEENDITIQHAERGGELLLRTDSGHIHVDGWCEETNTVFEFHGDLFHGNPQRFDEEDNCHPYDKELTAGELYRKTMEREEKIKSLGLNLVTIWESEWDQQEGLLASSA